MIIKSIQSENFLKYENLKIENLPEKGLFTVSGQNESGKTSIGETLCFALFGRTFTLDLSSPQKMIRWGESRCSVGLTFSINNADSKEDTYRIDRYLDDEGTYGAKFSRSNDNAILAKGVDEVNARILKTIGFGYDEFIESFYLAQRELTTPHPHSQTIKIMAGIAPLANIRKEITATMDEDYIQLDGSRKDFNEANEAYMALAIDSSWMPELKTSLEDTDHQIQARKSLTEELEQGSNHYVTAQPLIGKKKNAIGWLRFSGFILLLTTVFTWAIWGLLTQLPDAESAKNIGNWLSTNLPAWEQYKQWILPGAIASTTLLLINWLVNRGNNKKLTALKIEADGFGRALKSIGNIPEQEPQSDRIVEMLAQNQQATSNEVQDSSISIKDILTRAAIYSASPEEVTKTTTSLNEQQTQNINEFSSQRLAHEFAIREEQKRLDKAADYSGIMNNLEERITEQSHKLDVKNTAVELLESAGHHLSHKFNNSILKLAGNALPSFTQERYKHLKIDNNMEVRVFSNEKGDFLDFDEISSGTQRQVMLSLRLAMSQELINAIECSPQFIFLDEPFAFFDQERIRDTIAALPSFSKNISQIWIVAQEYPEGVKADLNIECKRDQAILTT